MQTVSQDRFEATDTPHDRAFSEHPSGRNRVCFASTPVDQPMLRDLVAREGTNRLKHMTWRRRVL